MAKMPIRSRNLAVLAAILGFLLLAPSAGARAQDLGFDAWLDEFRRDAAAAGIYRKGARARRPATRVHPDLLVLPRARRNQ
jgi:membrane-bound lytic murein transglycosylase B